MGADESEEQLDDNICDLKTVMPRDLIAVDELRIGKKLRPRSRRFSSFDEMNAELARYSQNSTPNGSVRGLSGTSPDLSSYFQRAYFAAPSYKSAVASDPESNVISGNSIPRSSCARKVFWHQDYKYDCWW